MKPHATHPGRRESLDLLLEGGSAVGLDDAPLLDRVARGEGRFAAAALDALIRRHGPLVARVCGGILSDPHTAEDAAQAVFLVLLRRAGSIRDPGRLASWLYGVALRTARAARAREGRHRRHLDPAPPDPTMIDPMPDPAQSLIRREQAEILHAAIARLPRRYLDPVVLCDLSGLTHAEAGDRLGCPEATVSVRLKRAREQLRVKLSRHRLDFEAALPLVVAVGSIPRALAATPGAHFLARRVAWSLAAAPWKAALVAALVVGGATLGTHAGDPGPNPPPPAGSTAPVPQVAAQTPEKIKPRDVFVSPPPPTPPVPPGKVVLGLPTVREVTDSGQYNASVVASRSVEIRAHLNGTLRVARFHDGDMVQEGDILFGIRDFLTENQIREKSAELTAARDQKIRAEENRDRVLADPAAPADEQQRAVKRSEAAEKKYQAVLATVSREIDELSTIRAPFAGQITRRRVAEGDTVEVGKTVLATINTVDPIWVNFDIPQPIFLKIQRRVRGKSGPTDLPVRVSLHDEDGFSHAGRVQIRAGQPAANASGTFTLHAEIPNADHALIPGLSASVRLEYGEPYPATLVPPSAIYFQNGEPRIFLVDANQVAHWEPVRLGELFDGLRQITPKLDPQTRIVLEGVEFVRDGVTVGDTRSSANPNR